MNQQSYQQLQAFFKEGLAQVLSNNSFELHALTQLYLIQLCIKSVRSEYVFTFDSNNGEENTLAQSWSNAIHKVSTIQRYQGLIAVGDRSLFVAGFFSDYFSNKSYDIDYYIDLGSMAYSQASDLQGKLLDIEDFKVFSELSQQFHLLVDIMSELSSILHLNSDDNVLRLYEKWLVTRSEHLLKKLEKKGVVLQKGKHKIIH